ncbi:hypothetical protein HPO96_34900 [Kribbella sandramycini]|uniref:Uncharacterized protein n=1 Tax=Kribbella sandramycini TaxID=60450 RepID=A0A7Y4L928_9ACTN|nr:hypothetical protein [Kribbella sandramycini]MBB6570046.1 hypothetical protein [Kribbella sandramycini]NOL45451.1 hypothetical protein [Kribbella sandramycini]
MTSTLTDHDKQTLRTAAYGAVSLLAAASPKPHKVSSHGTIALTSATGLVGHVLTAKSRDIHLTGKTTAELADQVLPALTAAVTLLTEHSPAEAENFRNTVTLALQAAQLHLGAPSPVTADMEQKITAALNAA